MQSEFAIDFSSCKSVNITYAIKDFFSVKSFRKFTSIFTRASANASNAFEYSSHYLPVICKDGEEAQSNFLNALERNKEKLGDGITAIYFGHLDGFHFTFPARPFSGACGLYDPRKRSWFNNAQTSLSSNEPYYIRFPDNFRKSSFCGFGGEKIMSSFVETFSLYQKNVVIAEYGDIANVTFKIVDDDFFLEKSDSKMIDWQFGQKINSLHKLGAVSFDLANALVFAVSSTSSSRLSTQYVDAAAYGELVTVSSVMEGNGKKYGVLGIDLTFLTPLTKLTNPLFENIFGGIYKSEVYFLDQFGQVIYHPRIGGPEFSHRTREKLSYKQVQSRFYSGKNEKKFIEDIEDLLKNLGATSTEKILRDDFEIHILLNKPPGLLMVVQFAKEEKEEIKNLPAEKLPNDLDIPVFNYLKKPDDCRIFLNYSVCYGHVDYPILLLDALKETIRFGSNPDFSSQNEPFGTFDIFEKTDRKYNKNLKTPDFIVEDSRELLLKPDKLTDSARRDLARFKNLQSILKEKFDDAKDEHDILRVFAATHSGLFFSYPHWNINPDYYASAEDWVKNATLDSFFTETLFDNSIQRISRGFSDEGRKSVTIVIGIDVLLSIENVSSYSTTFSNMNNTKKLCEETTCDCERHTSLQLPSKIESCSSIKNEIDCSKNIFCEFYEKCEIPWKFLNNKEFLNSKCKTVIFIKKDFYLSTHI